MSVEERLTDGRTGTRSLWLTSHVDLVLLANSPGSLAPERRNSVAADAAPRRTNAAASRRKLSQAEALRRLLAGVRELDAAARGRSAHIHGLRDLLRSDSVMVAAPLEQMKAVELSERKRADLYLALELAGTAEAQTALTSVIAGRWPLRDRMRALVALAGVKNPTAETLAAQWETVRGDEPPLSVALLTLGSLRGSMQQSGHTGDCAKLRDGLLDGLTRSSDAQGRTHLIQAVGNTGDASSANGVVALLDDAEPEVRRAAALSVGALNAARRANTLLARLDSESSGPVRAALVESLHSLSVVSERSMVATSEALGCEPDEGPRYQMVRYLGSNLPRHLQYEAQPRDLPRHEPSKRVR